MWRRVWSASCVVLVWAGLGFLALSFAPPVRAAPPPACSPADVGLPPAASGSELDALIRQAALYVEQGRLNAAQRLYQYVLTTDASDARAIDGIQYLEERRRDARQAVAAAEDLADGEAAGGEAAAIDADVTACHEVALEHDPENEDALAALAEEPATGTPATRAADRWDAYFKAWVDPTVRVVVPGLVATAVLLVLARALTPLVVRPAAPAWKSKPRKWSWGMGVCLLLLASLLAVSLALGHSWGLDGLPVRYVVLLLVVLLLAAVVVARISLLPRGASAGRARAPRPWITPALTGAAVGLPLVVLAFLGDSRSRGPWSIAVAVACVGIVSVAAARGHALRLLVQVKKGADVDAPGTAYVLARLQELGTSPPEGLKTPQQLDVDNLPSEALRSLPGGRVATALLPVVTLVLPATPWRVVVEDGAGDTRVVVTVTRNGSVVRTALVDPARFLPKSSAKEGASPEAQTSDGKSTGSPPVDRGDLLTAAAAVVLTELSRVHAELRKGLCGASRWESVAAHVVATKPPASAGGQELRRALLGYAVQEDPANALAQMAHANLQREDAKDKLTRRRYAEGLEQLLGRIEEQAGVAGGEGSVARDAERRRREVWLSAIVAGFRAAHRAMTARVAVRSVEQVNSKTAGPLVAAARRAAEEAVQRAEAARREAATARSAARKVSDMARPAMRQPTGFDPRTTDTSNGYLPLRLRARHELTATWLNVAVEEDETARGAAVESAAANYRALVHLLTTADALDRRADAFIEEMCRIAAALRRAFGPLTVGRIPPIDLPRPPSPERPELESLHALYDDACRLTVTNEEAQAMLLLERAASLERIRQAALDDPWFMSLRKAQNPVGEAVECYWAIVGPPAPAFTDLEPFGKKGADLRALGITDAQMLLAAVDRDTDLQDLAKSLAVPVGVVAGWHRLTELARPTSTSSDGATWLSPRVLSILVAMQIRSVDELKAIPPPQEPADDLRTRLHQKAVQLGVRPLDDAEFGAVAARAR